MQWYHVFFTFLEELRHKKESDIWHFLLKKPLHWATPEKKNQLAGRVDDMEFAEEGLLLKISKICGIYYQQKG